MGSFWKFIRWAGAIISPIGVMANIVLNGLGILQLAQNTIWIWTAIGLGVFFCCVVSLVYSQHKRLAKLENYQPQKGDVESTLRQSKTADIPIALSWAEQIALQDLDNLKQRIRVEIREIHFHGLKDKVPHFVIIVSLFNGSVFKVRLSQCIGFIQLSGSHCDPPQLERLPELEHGTGGRVELHQNLNDKTAEWLIEQATGNTTANLVGILCRFVFQVTTEGYNKQIEIPISEGGLNCIPKGIVIVAPNGNACNFMGQ